MSNMSALGFPVDSREAFIAAACEAADRGERIGSYVRWSVGEGVELWAQVAGENEVCGLNPHFHGPARLKARLDKRVEQPQAPPLDGSFLAWAQPDGKGEGAYPFCFDCPDARRLDPVELPRTAELQIAAFAHEFDSWPSAEAYDTSRDSGGFASRSFVPAGLFDPAEGSIDPPRPYAMLTGVVLASRRLVNPASGRAFHHFHVDSFGGEFDAVAPPELVGPEPPGPGGVVQGMFWLSGRVCAWYPG